MKVVSVNIGQPRTIIWQNKEEQTGIYKFPVNDPIFLGKEDVAEDHVIDRKYHGGTEMACYAYSADHYAFWKKKYALPDWTWGMFGENLTIAGLDESKIKPGDTFSVGEATIQAAQPRQPCYKLGIRFGSQKILKTFIQQPYPGIYFRIIREGIVKPRDELVLCDESPGVLTIADVHSLFLKNKRNKKMLNMALKEPFLAESCRNDIEKIYHRLL